MCFDRLSMGALLLGTIAAFACAPADGEEASAARADSGAAVGARVINVEVTSVALSDFVGYVRITGEVDALHDVTVSAEESGAIRRFYVEKGARVRRGQAIAKIDDDVLRAQYEEARALSEIADEQFERQRQLWEEEGIGSEIAYLQAKSSAHAARARLRTIGTRVARTVIRAPVTGIFDEDYLEIGEMASPGAPVVRIVAVDQVKIIGGVPERHALAVSKGDTAVIELDVFADRQFVGRISFVGATVDERNRTVPIEIVLDNPDGLLKPRMVANVQVELERLHDVIVVPQDVVVRTERNYQIFLVDERDGQAVAAARPVRLGASYANRVVVDSGLSVGDRLITLGHRLVDDQSRIRIVNDEGGDR